MKIFLLLSILVISSSFQDVNAQQRRGLQRGDPGYRPPMKTAYIPEAREMDPHSEVEIMLPKCVKEFNLDAFEKEIVKGLLLKKFENQNEILVDKDNNDKSKKQKLLTLDKSFYIELSSILTIEEVEQFKLMDFTETREEKKKKKRDKRKKG